jgi:hypothetical protein
MGTCPIRKQVVKDDQKVGDYGDKLYFDCVVCGIYGLTRAALKAFEQAVAARPSIRFVVSHYIHGAVSRSNPPSMDTLVFNQPSFGVVLDFLSTPTLREQANNLVQWLGDKTRDDPAAILTLEGHKLASIMAAASEESASKVVLHLINEQIISGRIVLGRRSRCRLNIRRLG